MYKTTAEVIINWVEIKAKEGNFLLNVGPDSNGEIAPREAGTLIEVGSWWFINHELFEDSKPFKRVQNDNGYFFLQSNNEKNLYIIVTAPVMNKTWQKLEIEGLKAGKNTKISLLGQGLFTNEKNLEDSKKMNLKNTDNGIVIEYVFLHNLYNTFLVNNRWNNPIVLKITDYKE